MTGGTLKRAPLNFTNGWVCVECGDYHDINKLFMNGNFPLNLQHTCWQCGTFSMMRDGRIQAIGWYDDSDQKYYKQARDHDGTTPAKTDRGKAKPR